MPESMSGPKHHTTLFGHTHQVTNDIDLLAPVGGGLLIGYARVSTRDQHLDRQLAALNTAGCAKIFADKLSGKNAKRPELIACQEYVRPGDTIAVTELARLGRSMQDLINLVGGFNRAGVGFVSLAEKIDTTTPGGRLIFHVFAALAQFIRELIVDGTNQGLAAARERGQKLGRPPALTPQQVQHAVALVGVESLRSIAKILGVGRETVVRAIERYTERSIAELIGDKQHEGTQPRQIGS